MTCIDISFMCLIYSSNSELTTRLLYSQACWECLLYTMLTWHTNCSNRKSHIPRVFPLWRQLCSWQERIFIDPWISSVTEGIFVRNLKNLTRLRFLQSQICKKEIYTSTIIQICTDVNCAHGKGRIFMDSWISSDRKNAIKPNTTWRPFLYCLNSTWVSISINYPIMRGISSDKSFPLAFWQYGCA